MSVVPHRYASALRAHITDLLKARHGRLPEPLGAYEKARIDRILSAVNSGRISFDDAQQEIGAAWLAAYGPSRQARLVRLARICALFEI
jgi:hypothetical protein